MVFSDVHKTQLGPKQVACIQALMLVWKPRQGPNHTLACFEGAEQRANHALALLR